METRLFGSGGVPWPFDAGLSLAAKIEKNHSEHEFELVFSCTLKLLKKLPHAFEDHVLGVSGPPLRRSRPDGWTSSPEAGKGGFPVW